MKTLLSKILLLIIVALGLSISAKADFSKKIHKSWSLKNVSSLSVENKFGNINFMNTRDDSVTIDVVIEINGSSESKARSIASDIRFEFSNEDGKVKAKTVIDNNFRGDKNFNINYTINIPINKYIKVENKFGNVTLGDLTSGGKFEISYGNIQGKTLLAPEKKDIEIELKYGNASFDKINSLVADIAYSKFNADAIGRASLESEYSTLILNKCLSLSSESQYDNFFISIAETLSADSKFTTWKIEDLKSKLELETEYGDVFVNHVHKDFEKIKVDNKYGNIRIKIDKNAGYKLKSDTQFCDTKLPKGEIIKSIKDDFNSFVEANIGQNSNYSTVNIVSKYGKVDLLE